MKQVQEDLRTLGQELWPDAQPLHPHARTTRAARRLCFASRTTVTGVVVGAAFFVAIVAGSIALATREHSRAPRDGQPSPSPNTAAVVPWLGGVAPDSASPVTIPGVPACRASDLSVAIHVTDPSYIGGGPINTSFWVVDVRDVSSKPCYLTTTFDATFQTTRGTLNASRSGLPAQDIIYLYPATQKPPAGFESSASGEVGSSGRCAFPPIATILWSPGPGLGFVRVSPGPAGGSGSPCANGVYSYYAELYSPTGDPARAQVLTTLVAPPAASPGDHVHFTVTLTNEPQPSHCAFVCPTPFPLLSLQPCPTFHEELEGVTGSLHTYTLNCAGAKPLAAGASETFDMYIDVPADASTGPAVLLWAVDQGAGMPHFQVGHAYMSIATASSVSTPASPDLPNDAQPLAQSLSWAGLTSGSLRSAEASCDATPAIEQMVDLRDVSDGVDLSFPAHSGGVFAQQLPARTVYLYFNSGVGPTRYTGFDAVSGTVTYSADGSNGSMDVWLAPDTSQINQAERDFHLTGQWRCR